MELDTRMNPDEEGVAWLLVLECAPVHLLSCIPFGFEGDLLVRLSYVFPFFTGSFPAC